MARSTTSDPRTNGVVYWGIATTILALIAGGILFSTPRVGAQEAFQGAVVVTPSPLNVVTAWGCPWWQGCSQTLQLTLQASTPVNSMSLLIEDLRRSDNAALLPSSQVALQLAARELKPGQIVTMTVGIQLDNLPAGEYTGNLLLSHSGGIERLPVTVRVRDWYLPPLILLIGTLLLGMAFKHYRDKMAPRDDLVVQVGYLMQLRDSDDELPKQFKEALTTQIEDARVALSFNKLSTAQSAIATAQTIWSRWSRSRTAWLELERKCGELIAALDEEPRVDVGSKLRSSLEEELRNCRRDMPLQDDPETIRKRLEAVLTLLTLYREVVERINALYPTVAQIADEETRKTWQATLTQQRNKLLQMTLSDLIAMEDLMRSVDADEQNIQAEVARTAGVQPIGSILASRSSAIPTKPLPLFGSLAISLPGGDQQLQLAQWRRMIFNISSIIITAVGLLPLGFTQLYVDKPTFGMNPWLDYPALIFWALGIEATREGVLGLVNRSDSNPMQ